MWDILQVFRWHDAIDIFLVSVVLYRIFLMFKGTRAVQMLVGLLLLAGASVAAQQLKLFSINWILENFWTYGVIALIILFQPELRRALARAGDSHVFRRVLGTSLAARRHVFDDAVKAAELLAAKRIGALMVIERAGALRHYAELGVPLDALVSADLLGSLFLPYSPLHDGAVLIQGDRVVAAGCFLPLSRNMELGRTLGTRHRAALGISEETDAVALVVSEETGRISLAIEGHLEASLDREALRRRLAALLGGGRVPARASFLEGLLSRWWAKEDAPDSVEGS
ncbi:MAG: diadenylate cyclase CdaA [Candidatus Methylomirabilia bacterium]